MDWLRKKWDRAALAVVGLIGIIIAALFVLKSQSYSEVFQIDPAAPQNELPVPEVAKVESAQSFLDQEVKWVLPMKGTDAPKPLPLFVSIPIVEVGKQLIDMNDPKAPMVRPPASNQWLLENGLDFLDGTVMTQDPDGDEFSNEEEWNAKTNPKDTASHPPYAEKLVLLSRKQQSYLLQFVAMPDDQRFQIVRLPSAAYPGRQNFMLQAGQVSEDNMFRVESVERKQGKNNLGITVDASELTITYLPTGETKKLTRGLEEAIPTYYAEFE
ncbi:MAG: hypothetical protein KDL87_15715, partial [Verrucomicrobiae bacterium]|nr:hypothetical protein [Verrucomicrobiae bacterium]